MTAPPLRTESGEISADAILEALHEGRRVIITRQVLDGEHEVTLRYDGKIYYCDTPTRLHRHETAEEMRACLDDQQYAT